MSSIRAFFAAAVLVLTLSSSGCGSGDEDKASAAISKEFQSDAPDGAGLSKKDADCVGDGWVDKIGVDNLKKYGVVTKDGGSDTKFSDVKMSQDDAGSAAGVLGGCTDLTKLLLSQAGGNLDASVSDCISEAVDEGDVEDVFATIFAGGTPSTDNKISQAATKCLTPS